MEGWLEAEAEREILGEGASYAAAPRKQKRPHSVLFLHISVILPAVNDRWSAYCHKTSAYVLKDCHTDQS